MDRTAIVDKCTDYFDDIKFIVIIPTYWRTNNTTYGYITRAIENLNKQRYKNWDLMIVGDVYEKIDEFEKMSSLVHPEHKCIIFNNTTTERMFIANKSKLWNVAGACSLNCGLDKAQEMGYTFYCHLDDDDYWTDDHLLLLANCYKHNPSAVCVYTRGTHPGLGLVPRQNIRVISLNNLKPTPCNTIHSSVSFRLDALPYRYVTARHEDDIHGPADAIMWSQIQKHLAENPSQHAIYLPFLTTYHDTEGSSIL